MYLMANVFLEDTLLGNIQAPTGIEPATRTADDCELSKKTR